VPDGREPGDGQGGSSTRGPRPRRGSWTSSRGGSRARGLERRNGRGRGQFLGWCEARGSPTARCLPAPRGHLHPRKLLESIDMGALVGLRSRALLFGQGSRGWLKLHEKGGKQHDVPAHHRAAAVLERLCRGGCPISRNRRRHHAPAAGRALWRVLIETGRWRRRVVVGSRPRSIPARGLVAGARFAREGTPRERFRLRRSRGTPVETLETLAADRGLIEGQAAHSRGGGGPRRPPPAPAGLD